MTGQLPECWEGFQHILVKWMLWSQQDCRSRRCATMLLLLWNVVWLLLCCPALRGGGAVEAALHCSSLLPRTTLYRLL